MYHSLIDVSHPLNDMYGLKDDMYHSTKEIVPSPQANLSSLQ